VTIQSLLLRTYITNGFPTDVGIQIYFTDSLYHKLDSLPVPPASGLVIGSGNVNPATGIVTSPTSKTSNFNFSSTNLTNLQKAKCAIIKGVLSTYNGGSTPVKIYSNYLLTVQIGAQAQLNVPVPIK
jgi:hypothetical protein